MKTTRLEAFSDGVLAIIITIMVLELRMPYGADAESLKPLIPHLLSYVMSFVYLGIYWNNHHHLLHTMERVTGGILWANLHLLFWLSLIPVATGWQGENLLHELPTALYGVVLFMAGVAYFILQNVIIRAQGIHSTLKKAVGRDWKGKASVILYAVAIGIALVQPLMADAIYIIVAVMWLVPDRRIEKQMSATRVP
ncbi:MAG: DUF1211 domain-containing protein [Ignavibacteriae bacterium]|nr:DUF1211 domain-containing protein [Ignavibacteriota bacterium]